jgi:hypothetical protein
MNLRRNSTTTFQVFFASSPRGYCATSYQKYSDFDLSTWQRCTRIRQPGGYTTKAVALDHSRIGHSGAQGFHERAQG